MTIGQNLSEFYGKPVEDFDMEKGIQNPTGIVYRLRKDWDSKHEVPEMVEKFAADPNASKVKALVIGAWDLEGDDSSPTVEALLAAKDTLKGLEALMFGDVTYEESEISWLEQTDLGPLINAFPNLVHFQCRGGNSLELNNVKHHGLKTLIIETGGLSRSVISDVVKADLPALEHLELWLGTDDYGFDGSIHDLRPFLEGAKWPNLKTLGLRNSVIADKIAFALSVAEKADASSVQVEGKTFVLTGTLHNLKRSDAEKQLASMGAKIGSGVSKTTDYLVAGEKAGSKMEKAKSLGVPVLSEADLMKILGTEVETVSESGGSILDKIKVLDLSMGTLTDEGAKALFENPKIKNLDKLDVHFHYLSDEWVEKLRGLPIDVDVADQQEGDSYGDDEIYRYVAVSE